MLPAACRRPPVATHQAATRVCRAGPPPRFTWASSHCARFRGSNADGALPAVASASPPACCRCSAASQARSASSRCTAADRICFILRARTVIALGGATFAPSCRHDCFEWSSHGCWVAVHCRADFSRQYHGEDLKLWLRYIRRVSCERTRTDRPRKGVAFGILADEVVDRLAEFGTLLANCHGETAARAHGHAVVNLHAGEHLLPEVRSTCEMNSPGSPGTGGRVGTPVAINTSPAVVRKASYDVKLGRCAGDEHGARAVGTSVTVHLASEGSS